MSLVARATTTSVSGRRQRAAQPLSTVKLQPNVTNRIPLDPAYLRALKVIDRTRRQPQSPSQKKVVLPPFQNIKGQKPRRHDQFSSTLTRAGQEAMLKTYEDTLISHITDVYSSAQIGAALPRLRTAAFRHRPSLSNGIHTRTTNIRQAQLLIDNLDTTDPNKERTLSDYVKWQRRWTKD